MRTATHRRQVPATGDDDILTVLLEAILYAALGALRLVWWLLVQLVRMPLIGVCVLAGVGIWVKFHQTGLLVAVGVLVVALAGWRLGSPMSFHRVARPCLLTTIRGVEHRARWPRIARRTGLVVHDWSTDRSSRPEPVRLTRVTVAASGLERLYLRLGMTSSFGPTVMA